MTDIEQQVRDFCGGFDEALRPLEIGGVLMAANLDTSTVPATKWWRRPSLALAGAALATLLLVGGGAFMLMNGDGGDVIADDIMTTTAGPATTLPPAVTTTEQTTTTTTVDQVATTETSTTTTTLPPTPDRLLVSFEQAPTQEAFGTGDFVQSVVPGGPGLIAVGGVADEQGFTDGAVWTSDDGLTWARTGDTETFDGVPTAFGTDMNQVLTSVTTGPTGFVAVGWVDIATGDTAPPVWLSPDGMAWERADESGFPDPGVWLMGVAANRDGYVAVGSDGIIGDAAIWTSDDGATWTRVAAGFGDAFGESSFDAVTWTGTEFIAVGNGGEEGFTFGGSPRPLGTAFVWASTDGTEWEQIELEASSRAGVVDVAADGATVAILGVDEDSGATWVSADGGPSFDHASFGDSRNLFPWAVLIDDDRILLVGMESSPFPTYAVAWASDDGGLTWFESARLAGSDDEGEFGGAIDQRPGGFRGIVEFGDRFIVVGATGNGSAPVWIADWKE